MMASGLFWVAALAVGAPDDPVVVGLEDEIARGLGSLSLPDAERPYHIGATLLDVAEMEVSATLGGVIAADRGDLRRLHAEVRVGNPEVDNSNFDTFEDGFGSRSLVLGDDPLAIRHDAWLLLDEGYKAAVEALAAKRAARRRRADVDDTPSFVPGPVLTATAPPAAAPDEEALTGIARRVSSAFLAFPDVEASRVVVQAAGGRRVMLDSRGTRLQEPVDQLSLRIAGRVRADDGATVVGSRLFVGSAGELTEAAWTAAAEDLASGLTAWSSYEVAKREYIGPVLFEGAAAAEVFRHLIVVPLSGTPPEERAPRGSRLFAWDDDADGGAMRVRRRILPAGWSVVDDPGRFPGAPSSYAYDWEGEVAQRVVLVEDGIVREHLMTRTPNRNQRASNGHARGPTGDLMRAMPSNLGILARRERTERRLHRLALRAAGDYDLDHYVVIRELTDRATRSLEAGPIITARSLFGFGEEGLPAPVAAFRVYADGREEPVRGFSIRDLDTRALKDIVAAGRRESHDVLLDRGPGGGIAVRIVAPAVLFPEVELSPAADNVEKPPLLPSPLRGAAP